MKYEFEVVVSLKDDLLDPQGKTIEEALPTLGWNGVSDVRVGKSITLTVEAESDDAAEELVSDMAEKFLSNPVIERFHVRRGAKEPVS
ncbi:MAG: phosphoribosylformylglycinamidine synthase subunit PurS [Actinomycetota bacterium]|nr:phosphoribosylformylglycinamidine synthase subunit PurS [Actinomycetota bacterium]